MIAPTAHAIARSVNEGRSTARIAVEGALARIGALDPQLNAFTTVRSEQARAEAAAVDALLREGVPGGVLQGVPIAVKEEYDVTGDVTSLGGRGNSTPATSDCEVVRRLRAAGAVIVGRTNMPEFGQFPMTESDLHGATLNPWDVTRSPGGSSGGSAVAVASGMVPVAMGADGGGSLRIPASACGVIGLKPSRGRVSSAPVAEHWHGLATFGAISRNARDLALVMDVISGNVAQDRWRMPVPAVPFTEAVDEGEAGRFPGLQGRALRILHASNPVLPGASVHPEIEAAMSAFAERLAGLGQDVRRAKVRWPVPTFPFVTMYLSGMRVEAAQVEHPDRLEPRTRTTVALGVGVVSPVLASARRAALAVAEAVDTAFASADLIMLPTLFGPVGGAHDLRGRSWAAAMAASTAGVSNTAIFNVSGHPAMSLHAGFTSDGMPVGAQVVARSGREDLLLALAAHLDARGGASPHWDASILAETRPHLR